MDVNEIRSSELMAMNYQNQPLSPNNPQGNGEEQDTVIEREVQRENIYGSSNPIRQMMQLLSSVQPVQQIQQTAQEQLSKGYLDIKV